MQHLIFSLLKQIWSELNFPVSVELLLKEPNGIKMILFSSKRLLDSILFEHKPLSYSLS